MSLDLDPSQPCHMTGLGGEKSMIQEQLLCFYLKKPQSQIFQNPRAGAISVIIAPLFQFTEEAETQRGQTSCQWQKPTWFLRLYSYSAVLLHGSRLFPHSQAITKTSWDIWGFQQCLKHYILCVIKDHNKDYILKLCYKTRFEKFHTCCSQRDIYLTEVMYIFMCLQAGVRRD